MKPVRLYITGTLAVVLLGSLSSSAVCLSYLMRPLSICGDSTSEARSINDSGQVAGLIQLADDVTSAVIWNSKDAVPLVIADNAVNSHINNVGNVAGNTVQDDKYHTFLWTSAAGLTELYYPETTVVRGINTAHEIVGFTNSDNRSTPFIWTPAGGYATIAGPGDLGGTAMSINESGQVVGGQTAPDGRGYAFHWSSATGITNLTPAAEWSSARAINDQGHVAGMMMLSGKQTGMFIWSAETGSSLVMSFATPIDVDVFGMNNAGTVVGSIVDHSNERPIRKAFAWDADTGLVILGEGIAYDINNQGVIAGRSYDYGAVLWEPVPEPASLLALAAGIAGLVTRRRR